MVGADDVVGCKRANTCPEYDPENDGKDDEGEDTDD